MDDSLINKLCDDLEPVQCTRHPWKCSFVWVIASVLAGVALAFYIGIRHDWAEAIQSPEFVFEMLLVALIGLSAVYNAALLRIPDMRGQRWAIVVPLTLAGVFVLWKVIYIALGFFTMPHVDFHHCMREAMMVAALPAIFMFIMSVQGYTTRPILMMVMNGLAVTAISYIVLRFTCPSDELGHTLYAHLLPFAIIGSVLGLLARRLYKW